jgi:pimeloyl-ACP methyl ester carboxylesterase
MKTERISIGGVPAIVCGEPSKRIFLFVHGMGGSKEEAVAFTEIVQPKGWQVVGVDLPEHGARKNETGRFYPWVAVPELRAVWDALEQSQPEKIALRANSIGAWFSMLAFGDRQVSQSLFVSPILDMSRLIEKMVLWANVTKEELQERKIIETGFGQPLSWNYYCYAKQHPIESWSSPTSLLYGSLENLTDRSDIDAFVKRFHCDLTVMENGEHWFHTEEQSAFMNEWITARV